MIKIKMYAIAMQRPPFYFDLVLFFIGFIYFNYEVASLSDTEMHNEISHRSEDQIGRPKTER